MIVLQIIVAILVYGTLGMLAWYLTLQIHYASMRNKDFKEYLEERRKK